MRPLVLLGVSLALFLVIDAYQLTGLRGLGKDRDRDDDDADDDDDDDNDFDDDMGDRALERMRRRLLRAVMKMKRFACEASSDPIAAEGILYELGEKLMRGCPVPEPYTDEPATGPPEPVTDQPGPSTGPPEPDTMPPEPATGPTEPDTMPPEPATAPSTAPPDPATGAPDPTLERRLALELKRLLERRGYNKRRFG